jgi:hypothetical protein
MTAPWFDPSSLIWIGPLVGAAEAAWGGVLAILAYRYAGKGKAQGLVFTHIYAGLVAAIALITSGVIAALQAQSSTIWASLLGLGCPLFAAAAFSLHAFGQIYRSAELRRMQAMEI